MSWETKQDYCGLAIADALDVKSATEGRTAQYLEKHGRNGDYKATKVFGNRASPTNAYTVCAEATIAGKKLGQVQTVGQKQYQLTAIRWSTGADAEPTVDGSSEQIEAGGTLRNYFAVPDFKISPDHVAQIPAFKWLADGDYVPAFSLPAGTAQAPTNVGVELTAVSVEISCSGKTNDKNGDPKSHDVTNGHIVIQLTLGQYGEQTPEITPGDGWDMSAPKTVDDPDSDMPTWTCTLSHPLEKVMQQAAQA